MSVPFSDTDPEAERVQMALLRAAPVARRLELACGLSSLAAGLAQRALRRAHPGADEGQIAVQFARVHYGDALATALEQHLAARPR